VAVHRWVIHLDADQLIVTRHILVVRQRTRIALSELRDFELVERSPRLVARGPRAAVSFGNGVRLTELRYLRDLVLEEIVKRLS
jgi:hypothetical protein